MTEEPELAARFEAHRGYLRSVAQRMLASRSDAQGAVQEAWLRLSRADATTIAHLEAWR
jgi:DNA-directed RNA polymerase specialized sigma24 family protein